MPAQQRRVHIYERFMNHPGLGLGPGRRHAPKWMAVGNAVCLPSHPSSERRAMQSNPELRSRIHGSLYGLAVGDALGAPYEFKRRGTYNFTAEMKKNSNFMHQGQPLPPGTWTDDTSMTLGLARSLVEKGSLDWKDIARRWVAWYEKGELSATGRCFDIGASGSIE